MSEKPVDSNKEASEVDCKLKVSKCLTPGAKTEEQVKAAIACLEEKGVGASP